MDRENYLDALLKILHVLSNPNRRVLLALREILRLVGAPADHPRHGLKKLSGENCG